MKFSLGLSSGKAAFLALSTLGFIAQDVLARPSPEPKSSSSWIRKSHGRKAISNTLKGKRDVRLSNLKKRNETLCAAASATEITAPKENIWDELDASDAVAVVAWLFAQPEFNLTVSEDAGEWDNTM